VGRLVDKLVLGKGVVEVNIAGDENGATALYVLRIGKLSFTRRESFKCFKSAVTSYQASAKSFYLEVMAENRWLIDFLDAIGGVADVGFTAYDRFWRLRIANPLTPCFITVAHIGEVELDISREKEVLIRAPIPGLTEIRSFVNLDLPDSVLITGDEIRVRAFGLEEAAASLRMVVDVLHRFRKRLGELHGAEDRTWGFYGVKASLLDNLLVVADVPLPVEEIQKRFPGRSVREVAQTLCLRYMVAKEMYSILNGLGVIRVLPELCEDRRRVEMIGSHGRAVFSAVVREKSEGYLVGYRAILKHRGAGVFGVKGFAVFSRRNRTEVVRVRLTGSFDEALKELRASGRMFREVLTGFT